MEFNERLRASRKKIGMTQMDLAERAGIAVNSVRLYESGKVVPKLDTIERIAAALDIDVNWLLHGYTLKEHDEAFILRLCGEGDVSGRDLYLQKHPDDEPAPARETAMNAEKMLLKYFRTLNETGQNVAVERVEELAKIPDYQRPTVPAQSAPDDTADKDPDKK